MGRVKARDMACNAILEVLAEGKIVFTTPDINERADCSHDTCIRMVKSMEERGWLRRATPTRRVLAWLPSEKSLEAFQAYDAEADAELVEKCLAKSERSPVSEKLDLKEYAQKQQNKIVDE